MLCGNDQKLPCSPFAFSPFRHLFFLFPLPQRRRNTFDFVSCCFQLFLSSTPSLPWQENHFSLHVCGQFFFFFFSALDLAGLLILTVGVSPTRVLVSWCDVCPQSALLGQGRTHGQQGPVRIAGMLFLRDSLDLLFHTARARTSTHLHCFSQRSLDPRVLFFISGLWRSFTLQGAGRSKLLHMFSSSVRRFRQRITEQIHLGNFRQRCAPACDQFVSRWGICWTGPRRNPDKFQRDVVSFRELHRPLQTTPKTTGASTSTTNRCARTPSRVTRLRKLIGLSMFVLYALQNRYENIGTHFSSIASGVAAARPSCIPVRGSSSPQSSRTRAPFSSAKSCRNSHASREVGATQLPAPLEEPPVAESISQGFARKFCLHKEELQPKHVKPSAFHLAPCAKRRTCSCNMGHVETSEHFPPGRESERPASQEALQERPFDAPGSDQHSGEHQRHTAFEGEPPRVPEMPPTPSSSKLSRDCCTCLTCVCRHQGVSALDLRWRCSQTHVSEMQDGENDEVVDVHISGSRNVRSLVRGP